MLSTSSSIAGSADMAQLFFVGAVILGVVVLWRLGTTSKGKASKRIIVIVFAGLVIVTIVQPEITTYMANLVGIGRGADLVFYLTSIGLMFLAALTYVSHKRTENRLAEVVSAQAADLAVRRWESVDSTFNKLND